MDNCLCFSKEDGLFVKPVLENDNPPELLFRPHCCNGKRKLVKTIPEENVSIEIYSKFGNNNTSYFYATISRNDANILDFDANKINVLNDSSVLYHCVHQYDWDSLFKKIIIAYNESKLSFSPASAISYIDMIKSIFNSNQVNIRGHFDKEKTYRWDEPFVLLLFAGSKIEDLIHGLDLAKSTDKTIIQYTMDVCKRFLGEVNIQDFDYTDKRIKQLARAIFVVHSFMNAHESGVEFLKYYKKAQDIFFV